ncbi:class IIb bacteriocin, lactobin A/cerein 7B family [Catenovulum sediminis]|uniref:Class IIb bacteriocin, lactobin A/cerein 7B family n=1 Tax=Catenovulum sediminis TaxID=1740262 RepID=A0ABV1RN55_9ALTE|nr:class IIb bacteriocin, lactobin A/cerein 7B family [Catenovulum sediminis]
MNEIRELTFEEIEEVNGGGFFIPVVIGVALLLYSPPA